MRVDQFVPGQTIAWRNCGRDAARRHAPSYAAAMTVVQDAPHQLVLYRGPGYPMRRRNAELESVPGFRHHQVVRLLDGWRPDPEWGRWRVLLVMNPDAHHSVSLFWEAFAGRLDFWYIDLIGPVQRRTFGFDFIEHGLDVVVDADMSNWHMKDVDELEWAVNEGRYSREEADDLYAEAKRAVQRLTRERDRFERWLGWKPDPAWAAPQMPDGWDETNWTETPNTHE